MITVHVGGTGDENNFMTTVTQIQVDDFDVAKTKTLIVVQHGHMMDSLLSVSTSTLADHDDEGSVPYLLCRKCLDPSILHERRMCPNQPIFGDIPALEDTPVGEKNVTATRQ